MRWCWTRSSTSPQILSAEPRNMSSVWLTVPSLEFSIGTTPKSAMPPSTSRNTSSIAGSGKRPHRGSEVLEHGGLGESALGTQKCHLERLLLREACRHDLAEQSRDLLVAQRPAIALERLAQHLRLALGSIEIDRLAARGLRDAHLLGEACALVERARECWHRSHRCARGCCRGRVRGGSAVAGHRAARALAGRRVCAARARAPLRRLPGFPCLLMRASRVLALELAHEADERLDAPRAARRYTGSRACRRARGAP